ncbi:uncharacterized protein LOC115883339 [Sitophilus oryzae]|uniref:Uncharacterized protein LOC115883339 n=1 Tax=Sitophilus oryzae TaxID=7048 RepID=A0A6J2Y1H2_SITOR|nr:uncharacterized protein LOC115883339 [Sitophilus oryzae]
MSQMPSHCSHSITVLIIAVQWYKDDQEFYRYSPTGRQIVQFPLSGINVDSDDTSCDAQICNLVLTKLRRPESSGAYRCEISSEAPTFNLVSKTHNVTIVAIPEKPPVLRGVNKFYALGDTLEATCSSDFGDPEPNLTIYLNKMPVSSDQIEKLPPTSYLIDDDSYLINNTIIHVRLKLNQDININGPNEISCVSSTDGIGLSMAPSLRTVHKFSIFDQNQIVNNQKFSWAESISSTNHQNRYLTLFFVAFVYRILNYVRLQ